MTQQAQEQIQAYAVQALWLQAVVVTLSIVGAAMVLLPKALGVVKEK